MFKHHNIISFKKYFNEMIQAFDNVLKRFEKSFEKSVVFHRDTTKRGFCLQFKYLSNFRNQFRKRIRCSARNSRISVKKIVFLDI